MSALENRIPPPFIMVIFAIFMKGMALAGPVVEVALAVRILVAAVLFLIGTLLAFAGVRTFRQSATTISPLNPDTASSLVQTGVYRFSRNPMYVGMAMYLIAWAAFLSSILALIGVVGFVVYMNRFQITPEERALAELFGSDFDNYQLQVRRWL